MPAKNMVWEIAMEMSRFPCIIWRSVLSCLLKRVKLVNLSQQKHRLTENMGDAM